MTKEQFEDKFEDAFDSATSGTEGGYGADFTSKRDLLKALYPAVEEFAKVRAIGFAKYMNAVAVKNGIDEWTTGSGMQLQRFTSAELYEQFLNKE